MNFQKHIKASVREREPYSVIGRPLSADLIKLNQNENPFDVPADVKRELVEEFISQPWNRYPEVFPIHLIKALAEFITIPEEFIVAANGSNELMYTIAMAIISKGTKVLIPTPTFFLYEKIVAVFEGEVVPVPAKNDLSFDVDTIIATARSEKPSLIVLNSPNSPTGQMLTADEVELIITSTDALVLVDEAYIEFANAPSILPLVRKYDRLIVLRTFSKAFSLAGLRIGYLVAQPALCAELLKPKIPFTVNNFSAAVAIKMMKKRDLIVERIQYIKRQKEILYRELCRIPEINVFPSQTNFLIFTVKKNCKMVFEHLLAENILIRDVSSYSGLQNTLRVNAGTEAENKRFLKTLRSIVSDTTSSR